MRAVIIVLLALVAACTTRYESFRPPPLDFSGKEPLRLAVDRVDVQSAFRPVGAPPYVEHTLPLLPEAAARQLLEHRLQAAGGVGSIQAVILDASVEEQPLEPRGGLKGYLTQEPVARLVGRLSIRVDRLDEQGNLVNSLTTAVSRTRSIPENATFQTRQQIGYELVRDLVEDLDAALVASVREHLGTLLR